LNPEIRIAVPKNLQILILVGAPGSGKSTFARHFIRKEENWMRLCRDDFRTMHFTCGNLPRHKEYLIAEMIDAAIEALLLKRSNVLLDATHCRREYINHYIERFNHLADISFKVFEADAATLAERCEKRFRETGRLIPAHILKKYIAELEVLKAEFDFAPRPKVDLREPAAIQDAGLPKAIVCDLDGTLALMHGRNPFDAAHCDDDELNEPVATVLRNFAGSGRQILLVSGREDCYRQPTVRFLDKHSIPCHRLWMRKTGDFRKDTVIKKEIFEAEIAGRYFIEFVLDDRNQVVDMWRKELHLPCFQVNYGNF
jgi:predicted kinase